MLNILHISDLHIHSNYDQQKVFEKFLEDIQKQEKIDLIVCSGDIFAKGIFCNESQKIAKEFFQNLKKITNQSNLILCPGNHDVNLRKRDSIFSPVFDKVQNSKLATELFDRLTTNPNLELLNHLEDYNTFASDLLEKDLKNQIFYTEKFNISGISVGIASLNSAWLTKGGGNNDQGQLYITERQIEKAYDQIKNCDLKVAIFHHTLDWLNLSDKHHVKNQLSNRPLS